MVASPEIEVYFYGPVGHSNLTATYSKGLEDYKLQVNFCSLITPKFIFFQVAYVFLLFSLSFNYFC